MAKRPPAKKPKARKTVAILKHQGDKRKNIPTAEYEAVIEEHAKKPLELKYPRNTDLDPQLVWRGKDEQDWSDLVVHAPPLYIQEKVHPKVLIDDLLRMTKESAPAPDAEQPSLWADFNGVAEGAEKTEFYQHDQNWSNRMILGDSLQVMASLAEREGLRGQGAVYLHRPAVRHQVQQQFPVVNDQPRREGWQRRRTSLASLRSSAPSVTRGAMASTAT